MYQERQYRSRRVEIASSEVKEEKVVKPRLEMIELPISV